MLRIAPDTFWRMTPRELALALRAVFPAQTPAIDRAAFETLMAQFPDQHARS